MEKNYVDESYKGDAQSKRSHDHVDRREILQNLCPDYYALYMVDLTYDQIKLCYSSEISLRQLENRENHSNYDDWVRIFSEQFVFEEDRKMFCRKLMRENCLNCLRSSGILDVHFRWHMGNQHCDYVQLRMRKTGEEENQSQVYLGIFNLSEEVKRQFIQRESLQKTLKEKSEQMDAHATFISKMSHEIRLLLNDIVTAQMVVRLRMHEKNRVLHCLDVVDMRCDEVRNILHNVWYISQLESGKIVRKQEPVELREVIEDILQNMEEKTGGINRKIRINTKKVVHHTVISDYRRLYHLFEQLLDNSVKYTKDHGEITIEIVENFCRENIAVYEFTIRDNGMGIEPEFMEHLYTPFYRSKRVAEAKIGGTGLGLAIVHNILKILDGEIAVESEPDKGTTFTVTLKLPVYVQGEGEDEP